MYIFPAASPITPFPLINECRGFEDGQITDCSIAITSPINITCSVYMYFPTIKLLFRHASTRVDAMTIREWNNTDGTRNKSVIITAVPSEDPYFCVASDIPGSGGEEKETHMLLYLPHPSSTAISEETTLTTEGEGSYSSDDKLIREYTLHVM